MIPQHIIDQILQLPAQEVIGRYIKTKKAGATYEACCPFHNEKTPSLKIFPRTNTYKCFGCGKGGTAITFVMEKEGINFPEACRVIATNHGIHIPKEKMTDEDKQRYLHREAILTVNQLAMEYFREELYKEENALALEYVKSRWEDESIELWDIGFAPDKWSGLIDWAKAKGIKTEILLEAGLVRESEKKEGRLYDYFRGRIMFPIKSRSGQVIGFAGRDTTGSEKAPKYLNSPESEIYNKSTTLFGIHMAAQAIRDKGFAYLVEGNADVVKMHQIGVLNTVCSSGTSLTDDQIQALKSIIDNISINLLFDGDQAGLNATHRAAKMIIKSGIPCNVVLLPADKGKTDPDSLFQDHDQFTEFATENIQDYILALAMKWQEKATAPDFKLKAVDEICDLISCLGDSGQQLYADNLGKIIPPKKIWTDKLKEMAKDKAVEEVTESIPKHISLADWEKFGFYEDHNCYYFKTKSGIIRGCNFALKPLFHIKSVSNAKRLFQITNEHGVGEVIELEQRDLVALARFRERVESLGNYLWEASETELFKLKRWLYEKTDSCVEITQLGWQKPGFYAWGNGIYNGKYTQVDANGIVRHKDINYYLPAFSSVYSHEQGLFINERRFIHRDGNPVSFKDYSKKLVDVFGDNAMIALCFYIATIYRDYIVGKFTFFPILNLFGPKGAGKTELAVSLMAFFGKQGKGPNINNTSKAALADHVAQVSNACVHIDEYKNNIDFEKIEFLKGLWDGTGRTRMNMDKDKKKETTAVDCGVILSGQEMPTADIALFSRLVYLTFTKTEYTDAEKERFMELKDIEKKGLTHITNELLTLREHFLQKYLSSYDQVAADLTDQLNGEIIEDRIFRNWLIILAAYHAIDDRIQVSFTYRQLIELAGQQIKYQNRETKKSNEVSTFWSIVDYLASDGMIQDGVDYRIEFESTVNTDDVDVTFDHPRNVLYIQMSRVFQLYRKHGKTAGEKILPTDSIDYYLKNDKRFLGKKRVRFKYYENGVIVHGSSKPMWSYVFLYEDLNLSLHNETTPEERHPEPKMPF